MKSIFTGIKVEIPQTNKGVAPDAPPLVIKDSRVRNLYKERARLRRFNKKKNKKETQKLKKFGRPKEFKFESYINFYKKLENEL